MLLAVTALSLPEDILQTKGGLKLKTSISRIMLTACVVLLAGSPAWAESEPGKCDARTLQGDYGFHVEGVILALPGIVVPPGGFAVRGVAMTRFDGKGKLTQVDFITRNGGAPPVDWSQGSGEYKVNPDCTGTWILHIPGNPSSPVKVHFVIVKRGAEIRTVVDANAVISNGVKVD